jgi:hypothetical protein
MGGQDRLELATVQFNFLFQNSAHELSFLKLSAAW